MADVDAALAGLLEAGVRLCLNDAGQLVFRGGPPPPELAAALAPHKEELRRRLLAERDGPIELLWATGLVGGKLAEGGRWDVGAGWWRFRGEAKWRRVPGREHLRMLDGSEVDEVAP